MVLYFYVLDTGWMVNLVTVAVLSILTFVPIKFVHPLRVTHWRNITILATILWAVTTMILVGISKDSVFYRAAWWVWIAASLYFAWLSVYRTFVQGDPDSPEDAHS